MLINALKCGLTTQCAPSPTGQGAAPCRTCYCGDSPASDYLTGQEPVGREKTEARRAFSHDRWRMLPNLLNPFSVHCTVDPNSPT
jgi:hypothetical protein